jgi:hypothetical protein
LTPIDAEAGGTPWQQPTRPAGNNELGGDV